MSTEQHSILDAVKEAPSLPAFDDKLWANSMETLLDTQMETAGKPAFAKATTSIEICKECGFLIGPKLNYGDDE